MQPKFRLINENGLRLQINWLHQNSGKTNEAQGSIGEKMRLERHIRPLFRPFEFDVINTARLCPKQKVAKVGGNQPNRLNYAPVA